MKADAAGHFKEPAAGSRLVKDKDFDALREQKAFKAIVEKVGRPD
jgi:hypothetical protein